MEKIAIIGSRSYTNKRKIKEFIYGLTEKFGEDLEIVSGGAKDGADKYAKQFSLEAFKYGKPYSVGNYHRRNKDLVEYSDKVVAFCTNGEVTSGTLSALQSAEKISKKYVIIS